MRQLTLEDLPDLFTPVPDFPEEGILFWNANDLTSVPGALALVTDLLVARCQSFEATSGRSIDYIAGFDARGFIFGGALADRLQIGFLQIRKKGKLPPPTVSVSYMKEYGPDTLEMNQVDLTGKHVVLVDDLLATGGTAEAGCKLIHMLGGTVAEFMAVIELPELLGRVKLQYISVYSLLTEIDGQLHVGVRYCVDALMSDPGRKQLLLIDRQSMPTGMAMVGGGIDPHETPLFALLREIKEEAGVTDVAHIRFHSVLTGADRDPRGPQVSLVYSVKANLTETKDETGKTKVMVFPAQVASLPSTTQFAFGDHYQLVQQLARSCELVA